MGTIEERREKERGGGVVSPFLCHGRLTIM